LKHISIIIPYVRQEKAARCVRAINEAYPHDCGVDLEILDIEDKNLIGCPKMVKKLTTMAKHNLVIFLGDDTIPVAGFIEKGLEKMAALPDGWGVVGLGTEGSEAGAHWMADKRMLELTGGEFFHTGYHHNFCDRELMDIAKENGRWAITREVVVGHDHYVNGAEKDEFNEIGEKHWEADRILYGQRKRARLGDNIAIGFPLVDPHIPQSFFLSYACMEKPDAYSLFVPESPHGRFLGSIADARNSIVTQALLAGCTHLLMMDTDQIYPADTLPRLMDHDVDVCGVAVHRGWKPYDLIFLRGAPGRYAKVSDEEAYSGRLIEVDATGTGCLFIKLEVFDKLGYPYFEFGKTEKGKPIGEDIMFCTKLREEGVKIHVDTACEVGHLRTINVGRWIYELNKATRGAKWAKN